jgi:hypothetical protein
VSILPTKVQETVELVGAKSQPVSIFLYGSRAREDFTPKSDYEVGVVYDKEKRWKREELAALNPHREVNFYPFVIEEMRQGVLDTPFPKAFYLKELMMSAQVVWGEQIFESIPQVPIRVVDVLEVLAYEKGYALASVLAMRKNNWELASFLFTKSALYGFKVLLAILQKKFVVDYQETMKLAKGLELYSDEQQLLDACEKARYRAINPEMALLYVNITFLNRTIPTYLHSFADLEAVVLP